MSDQPNPCGAQFRADRPAEQEAVRTTIVGGRPPGSGQKVGPIPRGMEVLLRKASVDDEFKELLLRDRAAAAEAIGLSLEPGEVMMLSAAPAAHLEAVIARTSVPQEHRRTFLGQAAAAMLAAMGAASSAMAIEAVEIIMPAPGGVAPDRPPVKKPKTVEERVIELVARRFKVSEKQVTPKTSYVEDLKADDGQLGDLRRDVEKEFAISLHEKGKPLPMETVGQTVQDVEKALRKKTDQPSDPVSRGVRPDRPPIATDGGTRPN